MIYGLSCACHPEAGLRYVGQTVVGATRRRSQHIQEAKSGDRPVGRWIRKHGGANLVLTPITTAYQSELDQLEIYWIATYRRDPEMRLLNATDGGQGLRGHALTPEHRAAISRGNIGRIVSPETRAAISRGQQGRTTSPETRALLSAAHKGKVLSPETRAKMSAWRTGRPRSPETIARVRAYHLGRKRSDEDRAKQSATLIASGARSGENHHGAILTWADVTIIRSRPEDTTALLGAEFGVTVDTIRKIRQGRHWPESRRPLAEIEAIESK